VTTLHEIEESLDEVDADNLREMAYQTAHSAQRATRYARIEPYHPALEPAGWMGWVHSFRSSRLRSGMIDGPG
jgi:hypothetical protein